MHINGKKETGAFSLTITVFVRESESRYNVEGFHWKHQWKISGRTHHKYFISVCVLKRTLKIINNICFYFYTNSNKIKENNLHKGNHNIETDAFLFSLLFECNTNNISFEDNEIANLFSSPQ